MYSCYESAVENSSCLEQFLEIRHTGTVMTKTPDFEVRDRYLVNIYRITWSKDTAWTIEEL